MGHSLSRSEFQHTTDLQKKKKNYQRHELCCNVSHDRDNLTRCNLHIDFPDMKHKYCSRVNPHWILIQRPINPGLELLVMIMSNARMQVLRVWAGCLDRDLFQYERQMAVVRALLLLVLADDLAVVLVLTAHGRTVRAVHQNRHCLSQLHQQPQQP